MTPTTKRFTLRTPHLALYWDGSEESAKEIETALREYHPRWGRLSLRVVAPDKVLCYRISSPWSLLASKPCWILAKHDDHLLKTYTSVEAISQHYEEVGG